MQIWYSHFVYNPLPVNVHYLKYHYLYKKIEVTKYFALLITNKVVIHNLADKKITDINKNIILW